MPTPREELPSCSVEAAITIVGGKWKLFIIRLLLLDGPQGFNQLARAIEGISNKVLTENLRELEAAGIVTVQDVSGNGTRKRYGATSSAERLLPILKDLGSWAEAHRVRG